MRLDHLKRHLFANGAQDKLENESFLRKLSYLIKFVLYKQSFKQHKLACLNNHVSKLNLSHSAK